MMLLGSMLPSQVQIRKLYQPQLFPNASVLPIFDKFFGPIGKRFLAASFVLQWSSVQGPEDRLCSWLWTKYLAQWGFAPARETLSRLRMAGKTPLLVGDWELPYILYISMGCVDIKADITTISMPTPCQWSSLMSSLNVCLFISGVYQFGHRSWKRGENECAICS